MCVGKKLGVFGNHLHIRMSFIFKKKKISVKLGKFFSGERENTNYKRYGL